MSETFTTAAARLTGHAALLLGWRPDEFWSATPQELAGILAALSPGDGAHAPSRGTLEKLMETFPDG